MSKKTKSMVVFVDTDFNLKLKEYMLNLEKTGVHKTKAEIVVELAQAGFKTVIKNQTK